MSTQRYAVIAGGEINGLGVARSLARAGIPMVILDEDLTRPTMRTRHGTKRRVASLEGETFLQELATLRGQFSADPILFLTQEKSVVTVSENLAAVARNYCISMPPAGTMRLLMNKTGFQTLAENLGCPVPRAVTLAREDDLGAARELFYPCIMKPTVKTAAYDQRFKKAYRITDYAAAESLFMEIKDYSAMIVQEWIEGSDQAIYFCLQYWGREQQPLASFVGRKLRSWPPRVGGTASCVAAPEDAPEVEKLTNNFFTKTGFLGMGSMEYKKDARTGRFVMIEPTVGRTDFQEEVATLNGVNIPAVAHRYESGESLDRVPRPVRPTAWVVSQLERWAREMQPEDGANIPQDVRHYDAIRRMDDPAPWLFMLAERLEDRLATWRKR